MIINIQYGPKTTVMIVQEILTHQFDVRAELDLILTELCEMILNGQQKDSEYYGMVAACVLCPDGTRVYGINHAADDGRRIHAERAALNQCNDPGPDCMVITTLSPCNQPMDERYGESCADLLASYGISHVYSGYQDPSQEQDMSVVTDNPKLRDMCKRFADTFIKENFADGKIKGKSRPGRVKRAGASCTGSVTSLRSRAKNSSGERARMYHWCANMKSGKKK